jgi:hypothetical protein
MTWARLQPGGCAFNDRRGHSLCIRTQGGRLAARLCLNGSCKTFDRHRNRLDRIYIDDPSLEDDGPVDVTLTITNDRGDNIFDGAATVTLALVRPNGPDCPPEKFAASLIAQGDSSLELLGPA